METEYKLSDYFMNKDTLEPCDKLEECMVPNPIKVEAKLSEFFFPSSGFTPVDFMKKGVMSVYDFFVDDLCIKYATSLKDRIGTKKNSKGDIRDVESVNVFSLLSGGSDSGYLVNKKGHEVPLMHLHNKHVMIACLAAPVISGTHEASLCCALISLGRSAFWPKASCQLVLVIVGKRDPGNQEEADFNHLFSGFHETVLAIPYSSVKLREDLYRSLTVSWQPHEHGVIIDPYGKIVQHSLTALVEYGPACFPFSETDVFQHEKSRNILKARLDRFSYSKGSPLDEKNDYLGIRSFPTLSLSNLVSSLPSKKNLVSNLPSNKNLLSNLPSKKRGPAVSSHRLARFPGLDYYVPLDSLDGKLVGLYLCGDGSLMKTLKDIQQQCSNLVPQFEIVVVPVALRDHNNDSAHHIRCALSHLNISSWWIIHPYTDLITRILPSIFGFFGRDQLILLPSAHTRSHSGDMEAGAVLSFLKYRNRLIDPSVYPFTKESLFHERLDTLSKVTVSSLLEEFKHDVIPCEGGPPVTLQSKNILLYLNPFDDCSDFEQHCCYVRHVFPTFKEDYPGCQVVCVFPGIDPEDEFVTKLPWLMISRPAEADKILRKALFLDQPCVDDCPFIVPFGEDGCVCSRKILDNSDRYGLPSKVPAGSLFEPKLRQEIFHEVVSEIKSIAGPVGLEP